MAQEEEQAAPQSIQQRIAALKLQNSGSGAIPGTVPPSYQQATGVANSTGTGNGVPRARPPPPPRPNVPPRPAVTGRAQSTNVPPTQDHGVTNGVTGTQPAESAPKQITNGTGRPTMPSRTSTSSSRGPSLPPRRPSEQSPSLPPRRPSEAPSNAALSRKASQDSVSSVATARSSVSGMSTGTSMTSDSQSRFTIRAPAFDASSLPPLPPKRTQEEKDEASAKALASARRPPPKSGYSAKVGQMLGRNKSSDAAPTQRAVTASTPSARVNGQPPPPLPGRNVSVTGREPTQGPQGQLPAPTPAPPPRPRQSALSMGFGNNSNNVPTPPTPNHRPETAPPRNNNTISPPAQRPSDQPADNAPPPIPTSSRPDLSALLASKPKPEVPSASSQPAMPPQQQNSCMKCRDFSGPDNHAARFPRHALPSQDLYQLAMQLTQPFPSPTDKARAIFTWLHHNIDYDVKNFFAGTTGPSTPASTFQTGLAVCQGYAELFATLALQAGLQALVISGHGKGYSHTAVLPGQAIPPYKATHAWNAVQIDAGEWHLIDPCWGAGNVSGPGKPYNRAFTPAHFTKSNNDFGLSHFPANNSQQFRSDNRCVGWEEYMLGSKKGTAAHVFSGYMGEEGIDDTSLQPKENPISLSLQPGPSVRFSFQKVCRHWDPVRNGRGPHFLYMLTLEGVEGYRMPFREQGGVWWCDVPVGDLRRARGKVHAYAVIEFDGRSPARGLGREEFLDGIGRKGMRFGGLAQWDLRM